MPDPSPSPAVPVESPGEGDVLAPLLPFVHHEPYCAAEAADEEGRDFCDCDLPDALAAVRANLDRMHGIYLDACTERDMANAYINDLRAEEAP